MSNFYLALIFVVLIASTSLVFYRGRPSYLAKFMVVALCAITITAVSFSFESYKGWPSQETILKGRMKGVEIVHPGVNTSGKIYVWVYPDPHGTVPHWIEAFLYQYPDVAPRSFVLPYNKQAAKKYENAKKAIANGDVVTIEAKDGKSGAVGGPGRATGPDGKGKSAPTDEDTSSGAEGDTPNDGDNYNLKITPPDAILKK